MRGHTYEQSASSGRRLQPQGTRCGWSARSCPTNCIIALPHLLTAAATGRRRALQPDLSRPQTHEPISATANSPSCVHSGSLGRSAALGAPCAWIWGDLSTLESADACSGRAPRSLRAPLGAASEGMEPLGGGLSYQAVPSAQKHVGAVRGLGRNPDTCGNQRLKRAARKKDEG